MTTSAVPEDQTSNGVTLNAGDQLLVLGLAIGTVVNSGGQLIEQAGGSAQFSTVNSGGNEFVSSGGDSTITRVDNGSQTVFSGGIAAGTILNGGTQLDYGMTIDTIVNAGGTESLLASGAPPPAARLPGGAVPAVAHGTALDTRVNSGGVLLVAGGTASQTSVNSGGIEQVASGGTTSGTTLYTGGVEHVLSGGTAIGTLISDGGNDYVSAGGTASGTTVFSGGNLQVAAGGSVTGGLTISGGGAFVAGSVAAGQTVGFAGAGGDLALANLGGFAGAVSGFAAGDQIDLFNFSPGGAAGPGILGGGLFGNPQWTFTEAASLTSGTLTVVDGPQQTQLTLLGNYGTGSFALSNDGGGDILVKHT